jgi:hypothetical protein
MRTALAAVAEHRNFLAAQRSRIDVRFGKQLHRTTPKSKFFAPEKKTPQAFRVRGLVNEASSSSQTPAPVAVEHYRKGDAVSFHLSLMKNRARMIQEKTKACQRFSACRSRPSPPSRP